MSGRYGTSVPAVNQSDQTSHTEDVDQVHQQQAQCDSRSQATDTAEQAASLRNQAQSRHRSRDQNNDAAMPTITNTAPVRGRGRQPQRGQGRAGRGHRNSRKAG